MVHTSLSGFRLLIIQVTKAAKDGVTISGLNALDLYVTKFFLFLCYTMNLLHSIINIISL